MAKYKLLEDKEWLYEQRVNKRLTIKEIAELVGCAESTVKHRLKQLGIVIPRKQAAKFHAERGRYRNPYKGKKRPKEHCERVSLGLEQYYSGLTDEQRKQRIQKALDYWRGLDYNTKRAKLQQMGMGWYKALQDGSLPEHIFYDRVLQKGIKAIHQYDIVPARKYKADIFLPEYSLDIEVDGPKHFKPSAIIRDTERDGQVNAMGIRVVRLALDLKIRYDKPVGKRRYLKVVDKIIEDILSGKIDKLVTKYRLSDFKELMYGKRN